MKVVIIIKSIFMIESMHYVAIKKWQHHVKASIVKLFGYFLSAYMLPHRYRKNLFLFWQV